MLISFLKVVIKFIQLSEYFRGHVSNKKFCALTKANRVNNPSKTSIEEVI